MQSQKLSQKGRCKGWTGKKTIYSRSSMKFTADNSRIRDSKVPRSDTERTTFFVGRTPSVLTADVPSSFAGTVPDIHLLGIGFAFTRSL